MGQALPGKLAVSLLGPTAFTFASDLAMLYEGGGEGLTWSHLWTDGYPLGAIMLMLALDTVLYSMLAVYLQTLFSKASAGLPFYFPFLYSYWSSLQLDRYESPIIWSTSSSFSAVLL